ncbi:MAG: polyphosphate kinase 1 [Chloroflexia bacterium]|nr:polyphosphate kinase 1 [Chloroflexia bacterium]
MAKTKDSGATSPKRRGAGADSSPKASARPAPAAGVAWSEPLRIGGLELPPLLPEMFINRELSWLEFNRRVLEEGLDEATPLLERLKFAAIFCSNLDEFFMIRVAGVKRKLAAGVAEPGPDGRTPTQQLAAIRQFTQQLLDQHAALWCDELLPRLATEGISILSYADLTPDERMDLATRFEQEIFPVLTPQAIDRGHRFPHVSNGSLNLIVSLRLPAGPRFARIKIPATLPRLIQAGPPSSEGDQGREPAAPPRFVWLEQLVAAHLPRLFVGAEIISSYPFHVTRDSDIELDELDDDDETDMVITMRESIALRAFGPVVRLMTERSMPLEIRDWLRDQLHATERDLYEVDGPLAGEDLIQLTAIARPDLKDPPFVAASIPDFVPEPGAGHADIFATLRERDVLVHHPYQSFNAVSDFVRAASSDPDVVAIKQTLYRIGKDSPLIPALIEARDDDTQVAVLVELKARFDEENNISWAKELERHGVHVAYGLMGLKTHCKATLVVRREASGLRRYVHLATGNYNASTARLYEDIGLLSARGDLGSDVSELFNALTGYAHQDRYQRIWVAPGQLRERFLAAIARETKLHLKQGGGYLIFKANALVDRTIIRALYAASRAGVKIDLVIRGACCLRPGIPGWSESIRVVSIVGRFLEHSRIYYFRNGGEDEVLLGSADLMERNLDRRVEVIFPVDDAAMAAHIRDDLLPAYLRDTVNARQLQPDGSYQRILPAGDDPPFDVQHSFLTAYRSHREREVWPPSVR